MQVAELIVLILLPLLVFGGCLAARWMPSFRFGLLPILAVGVVLVGSVFGHDFFNVSVGPLPLTLDRLLLIAAVGTFGIRWLLGFEQIASLNRIDIAVLIWLVVISVSTLTHDFKAMENLPASRLLFFNWMPVALYLVIRHAQLRPREIVAICSLTGLLGIYLALTAIAEMRGLSQLVYPRYIMTSEFREFLGRGRGPFLNPVSNGIFMTLSFCCVLMAWPHLRRTTNWFRESGGRLLIGVVALLLVVGIYATLTRSVWLGLVVACGIFLFLPAPQQYRGLMVVGATVAMIVLFPVLSEKLFSFKRDQDVSQADMEVSAQMRPMFAIIAWNMFQDRPLTGVGFGQYTKAKFPYLKDPHTDRPLTITRSLMQHNVFLAYLTEMGLIGVGALSLMLVQFGWGCWSVWRDRNLALVARQLALAGVVLIACYSVNGMFHDVSIIPMMHTLMFFWLGMVNNVCSRREQFQRSELGPESLAKTISVPQARAA